MDNRRVVTFLIFVFTWLILGAFAGPLIYVVAPITWYLWLRAKHFQELFIGFIAVLVISDSLEDGLRFAGTLKSIYILFLGLVTITNRHTIAAQFKILGAFAPYLLVATFCLIWSPTVVVGFQKTLSYTLLLFVVPVMATHLFGSDKGFCKSIFYIILGILTLSVALYGFFPEVGSSHGGRMRGVFGNPNGLGLFIILSFLFYQFTMWQFKSTLNRYERMALLALVTVTTIYSGSRNALLSITLFYVFEFAFRNFKYLGIVVSIFIVAGLNLVVANAVEIIQTLSLEEFFRVDTLVEGSGRLIAWKFAWQNIQESFYLGKGIGFDEHLMRTNSKYLSKLGHEGGVHNTYLIIWLNTGLIGLICFFSAIVFLFVKASRSSLFAFPFLFTVLFSISFEPWLAASLNPYTIIFLTILSGLFVSQKSALKNKMVSNPELE